MRLKCAQLPQAHAQARLGPIRPDTRRLRHPPPIAAPALPSPAATTRSATRGRETSNAHRVATLPGFSNLSRRAGLSFAWPNPSYADDYADHLRSDPRLMPGEASKLNII